MGYGRGACSLGTWGAWPWGRGPLPWVVCRRASKTASKTVHRQESEVDGRQEQREGCGLREWALAL